MDAPEAAADRTRRSLGVVREQLRAAAAADKCHPCGCLHETIDALSATDAGGRGELAAALGAARAVLGPRQYDCLGCAVCFPAIAANAFAEAFPDAAEGLDPCPTEAPDERQGWPPLPGDCRVLRYGAPVAVCTLNSDALIAALEHLAPPGLSIVGTLHTENLGIERLIRNTLANPNLRFLVLCGEDTRQAVGHLPGQSLASLFRGGLDDRGRIVGALGKRPVLKNVPAEHVRTFLRQHVLVDLIGEESAERVAATVQDLAARSPGPFGEPALEPSLSTIEAREPGRLVPDPAGFFVVYPDGIRRRLVVEHYTTEGVLDCVLAGPSPAALVGEIVERGLLSRLDHAAYLGRELGRAEQSLLTNEPYRQDRAPGEVSSPEAEGRDSCGCARTCGGGG